VLPLGGMDGEFLRFFVVHGGRFIPEAPERQSWLRQKNLC
jgi:hypothetical protein